MGFSGVSNVPKVAQTLYATSRETYSMLSREYWHQVLNMNGVLRRPTLITLECKLLSQVIVLTQVASNP